MSVVEIKKSGMERVAQSLLIEGPASARTLSTRLGVTPAAVRRHLDSLVDAGWAAFGPKPTYGPARVGGRGRPARVYSLTADGRTQFAHGYDNLAVEALQALFDLGGKSAVERFARTRASSLYERISSATAHNQGVPQKADVAVSVLNQEGYAATVSTAHGPIGGLQLCQHNCPIEKGARHFPELCEEETKALGKSLGVHVTRIATIAAGDGVCTTMIPIESAISRANAESAASASASGLSKSHSKVSRTDKPREKEPVR